MILSEKYIRALSPYSLLLIISITCYWEIFNNYLYLDDTSAIFAGYLLSSDIARIFTYNFDVIYMSPLRRVVVALSYLPNYLISGADPWSYYLVNLLLHFGNSVLVYLIIKKLSNDKILGILTAVLFSVSLNKADAVMMIAHRTTLMGAFFALFSLLLYIKILLDGYERRLFLCLILTFLAALGSYETAIVLPAVFLAIAIIFFRTASLKKQVIMINIFFICSVALLIQFLEIEVNKSVISETDIPGKSYHILRNILGVFVSFAVPPIYLQSLTEVFHSQTTYIGWREFSSLSMISIILLWNYFRLKDPIIYFGLIFFLIVSIPTATITWIYYPVAPSSLFTDSLGYMRWSIGKYSYLSSFGYFMILSVMLHRSYFYLVNKWNTRVSLINAIASIFFISYFIFNIFWIYDRGQEWDEVTNAARKQIDSLKKLNINPDNNTTIYIDGFVIYWRHAEYLFRVIYDRPHMKVRSIRDFRQNSYKQGQNAIFLKSDMTLHVVSLNI